MSRLHLNAVGLPGGGAALFALPSFINHSCDPNALVSWEGGGAVLRLVAQRPIQKGEEIFISSDDDRFVGGLYSDGKGGTCNLKRRSWLEEHYGFRCSCRGCTTEVEGGGRD